MELLVAGLAVAALASLVVLVAGFALARYRERRSRRRLVPPRGDPGT